VPRWRETHCDGRAVAVRPAWGAAGKAQAREHGTGEGAVWVDTDYLWVERWRCGGAARAVDVTATGDNGEWAGRASPRRVAPPARNQWYSTGWRAPLTGPRAASPTGKISWISSHFQKRRSDTHRRNISVCRLQVDPPYSGRGGPHVVKDPGKKLDLMALWLAHNAPHFTASTHLIGSLCPLTLLLIVVDLYGIY